MKLTKSVVGKVVRITWHDPRTMRLTSHFPDDHRDVPKGRRALAEWVEYGLVEAIDEGVLLLRQSMAHDPPGETNPTHELQYSVVPEDLIDVIAILNEDPRGDVGPEPEGRRGGSAP
jgi:hypothetical protein